MEVIVSVIIPVYNSEKYLKECLDSVLSQSLKEIEIICVNDCSEDSSEQILEEYSGQDDRISHLKTEKNSGQAYARNMALKQAKGKYIYYLDSDDLLMQADSLENMVRIMETYDIDGCIFDSEVFYETKRLADMAGHEEALEENLPEGVYDAGDFFGKGIQAGHNIITVWRQCWKREFLINNELYFDKFTSPHEDLLFYLMSFVKAKKIYYYPKRIHKFRLHEGSSTTTAFSKKRYLAYARCMISGLEYTKCKMSDIAWQDSLFGFFSYVNSFLVRFKEVVIRQGEDLNDAFKDDLAYRLKYRMILMHDYPYLNRMITPEEYHKLKNSEIIVVYGAGEVGRDVIKLLENFGFGNYVIAVTSPYKGQVFEGHNVLALNDAIPNSDSTCVILAASIRYKAAMENQLNKLGIVECINLCSIMGGFNP